VAQQMSCHSVKGLPALVISLHNLYGLWLKILVNIGTILMEKKKTTPVAQISLVGHRPSHWLNLGWEPPLPRSVSSATSVLKWKAVT